MTSTRLAALAAVLALSTAGCGGSSSPEPLPPSAPTIQVSPASPLVGQAVTLTASSTDPQASAITYTWTFGDGGSATGATVTHAWQAAGTFSIQATATNALGKAASSTASVTVSTPVWTAYCSGANCGASGAATYSGSGVGVWRLDNPGSAPLTATVSISGVRTGQTALLLLSNGRNATTTLPVAGVLAAPLADVASLLAMPAAGLDVDPGVLRRDAAHAEMLRRNREVVRFLESTRGTQEAVRAAPVVQATPALGATRDWIDNGVTPPQTYTGVVVRAVCPISNGRNAVFWVDPASWGTDVTQTSLDAYVLAFCGASGGYARATGLLGDAWGSAASNYSNLILDGATPQDVNVVFLGVADTVDWGGYFWSGNNLVKSSVPTSNEALAFFVNAPNSKNSTDYYISVLVHEMTHMINFYQRYIVRDSDHDLWLEETSAMMTEDIVTPVIAGGYSTIASQRIGSSGGYLYSGGAVSLVTWDQVNVPVFNYAMGGALGAFLNRRYGTGLYVDLSRCPGVSPTGTTTVSYTCLDGLIRSATYGGAGLADEIDRMGASVFALLPATGIPAGFGYPQTTSGDYTLPAIDVSAYASRLQNPATPLGTAFTPTTQTYAIDTIAGSTYARGGIVVPPGTTALLVIR